MISLSLLRIRLFLFFSKKKLSSSCSTTTHHKKPFNTHLHTREDKTKERERERSLLVYFLRDETSTARRSTSKNGRRRAANPSRLPRSLASNRLFGVLQRDAGWHFPRLLEQRWETDAERRDDRRLDRNV